MLLAHASGDLPGVRGPSRHSDASGSCKVWHAQNASKPSVFSCASLVQVLSKGGEVEDAITTDTTHVVLVHPPSTGSAQRAVSDSSVQAPAAVLDAVLQAGGGSAGLQALRTVLQHGTGTVIEAG